MCLTQVNGKIETVYSYTKFRRYSKNLTCKYGPCTNDCLMTGGEEKLNEMLALLFSAAENISLLFIIFSEYL